MKQDSSNRNRSLQIGTGVFKWEQDSSNENSILQMGTGVFKCNQQSSNVNFGNNCKEMNKKFGYRPFWCRARSFKVVSQKEKYIEIFRRKILWYCMELLLSLVSVFLVKELSRSAFLYYIFIKPKKVYKYDILMIFTNVLLFRDPDPFFSWSGSATMQFRREKSSERTHSSF